MAVNAPKQADHETQRILQEIEGDLPTEITLSTGRKVKVGWIKYDALNKMDDLIVEHDRIAQKVKDGSIPINKGNRYSRIYFAQVVAAILLNSHFGIRYWWWLKWRLIYNYWGLNGADYEKIMLVAKKKATEQQYLMAMVYSTTMNDIWTMMTKKEAEAYRRAQKSESEQPS